MRNRLPICLAVLTIVASHPHLMAQQNYLYGTGNQQWGINIPIDNGFINVANGEVHLEISLASTPQRGSLQLNERLVYDSRIWKIVTNGSSYGFQDTNVPAAFSGANPICTGNPQSACNGGAGTITLTNVPVPNSMAGWRFVSGGETGIIQGYLSGGTNLNQYSQWNWGWTDPMGTTHLFNATTGTVWCPSCGPSAATAYAMDGSGYYITVTNYNSATVYDANGDEVYPAIVDRNGNTFTTDANGNLKDSIGNTPVLVTTSGNNIYYDVLTIGGARKRYTVTTESINVSTHFQQSGTNEKSDTLTAIQSITLPDGNAYSFTYDSGTSPGNYGELQSMTLPTGGTVSFSWQNFLDSFNNENRWLSQYSGGNGSYTLAPQVSTQCTGSGQGCQERMSVVDGNTNRVIYLLTLNNGAWNTQMDYYTGFSLHAASVATSYDYSNSAPSWFGSGSIWVNASSTITTLPDTGQMAKTQYTYANPAIAKPSAIQQWDYYTGALPSIPTKETDYTYGYTVNGAAFVTQTTQLDSTGNSAKPAAQVNFVYDYGTSNGCSGGTLSPTSLPNHQSVSGARGNLTCVVAVVAQTTPPTTVTTSSTFDDAGTKLSDTDANLNLTSYATMCSDAFVQTVSYPVIVNGLHLRTMNTTDCPSGLPLSSQDMNGVVSGLATTFQYFTSGPNIGRVQTVSYPDSGRTTYSYPSVTETDQVIKQTSSVNVTKKIILDSFGRPNQSAKVAPEGTLSSEVSYDATGTPSCAWTPHLQGTLSGTDGSTCNSYDVLGRITYTTMRDNNLTASSYSGATQTTTDELVHQRKYTYDAFHRLTSVVEPNSNGTLSYETDYYYNALDQLTEVDQWGGAKGAASPGKRMRQFAYDNLGRKIAENIPENQSSTSPASLTCQNAPSGTKWTMCFLYDGNGNVTQTTDNSGTSLNYAYDGLNRVLSEVLNATGAISHQYRYDGTDGYPHTNPYGYRTYATDTYLQSRYAFNYDPRGRMTKESVCVPVVTNCDLHTSSSVSATYDFAGNMVSITYPDGRVVGQTFDSANRFNGTSASGTPYYSVSSFAPPGQPTNASFGNGVGITTEFNNRGSITSLKYTNSSGNLWWKQFGWDKNAANLLLLTDKNSGNGRQFAYDTLNRITSATDVQPSSTPASATLSISGTEQQYTFDPCQPNHSCPQTIYDGGGYNVSVNGVAAGGFGWGSGSTGSGLASLLASNIDANSGSPVTASASGSSVTLTSKTLGIGTNYPITVAVTGWNTYFASPSFAVSSPSALSGGIVTMPGGLNEAYGYDPFGNLTQSGNFGFSQSFNSLNQMSAGFNYDAKGEETADIFGHTLAYDALGELLSTAGTGETYTYDTDGNRVEVKGTITTDFIYFDGVPVALLSGGNYTDLIYGGGVLIAEVPGSGAPAYRAADDLATLAGAAPSSGPITGAVSYAPYGQLFSGSTTDPFGFTGLEWDPTTALWHAGARQFSPQQGRWMTPDPYEGSYNWADPQSLNRYGYVNGRPTVFTDPSGLEGGCGFLCGIPIGPILILLNLGGGPSFNGSLEPRPSANPWSDKFGVPYPGLAGSIQQALGVPTGGCEFGACGPGVSNFGQNGGHAPMIDLDWWRAYFSDLTWQTIKESQSDAWKKGYYKCWAKKNVPGFSLFATIHVGGDVAIHTADHFAPKIAGTYYHFTDGRFTAWGKYSKVLVPELAGSIKLWAERLNVAGLAYADYEAFKSIGECSELLK